MWDYENLFSQIIENGANMVKGSLLTNFHIMILSQQKPRGHVMLNLKQLKGDLKKTFLKEF